MPKRKSHRKPRLAWAPYHHLLAYHLAQGPPSEGGPQAHPRPRSPSPSPAPPVLRASPSWRKPSPEALERARAYEITDALESLCRGARSEARLRLDRLLLAYARSGFAPEAALREVHLDYRSMDDVPPLTEAEVAAYARLFWDFLSLGDPESASGNDPADGTAYLEAAMPGSEEVAVWRGERPLARVRASCLVLRGLARPDFGGAVAVRVNDVMGRLVTQIEADVAELGTAGGDPKALKDRAMLLARLSLAQDRLRRGQDVDAGAAEVAFGLDELFGEIEEGRARRRTMRPDVPWEDPAALIRQPAP